MKLNPEKDRMSGHDQNSNQSAHNLTRMKNEEKEFRARGWAIFTYHHLPTTIQMEFPKKILNTTHKRGLLPICNYISFLCHLSAVLGNVIWWAIKFSSEICSPSSFLQAKKEREQRRDSALFLSSLENWIIWMGCCEVSEWVDLTHHHYLIRPSCGMTE